ncbi:general stress protein [Cohnella abietis]|uniref:Uncharacterized protein n=1 Tax=Cohnella abietis TaxID=2507935 RepID=A0A3T1DBG5_9BACL|nr:general stress protein [Cohnella abietis]BBI35305.1 hypothetical protein KCTCHS21_47040 [Cohnella abietis]
MTVTIGIFDKEDEVLQAVRLLREAGVEQEEIRVVVNNREGAPLLAADGEVAIEELYEIQAIRSHDENGDVLPFGTAPMATGGFPVGSMSMNSNSGTAGVVFYGSNSDEEASSSGVLHAIGIPENAAKQCGQAVESGQYLLVAKTDPELDAQDCLRQAGASDVFQ